jgi:hypothetical protein
MRRPSLLLLAAACAACSVVGPGGAPNGPPPVTDERERPPATDAPDEAVDPVEARLEAIRARLDQPVRGDAGVAAADELREGRWRLRDGAVVEVAGGVPWGGGWPGGTSRAQLRSLHGLLIVHTLVATGRDGDVDLAESLVADWVAANPREAPVDPMAWHDETTARRTSALVRLHDALHTGDRDRDGTRRAAIREQLALHLEALLDDDFHATGTNHGMFQDRAALAASAYLDVREGPSELTDRGWDVARERLLDYFRVAVLAEGVHREHAPAYHQTIAVAGLGDAALLRALGDDEGADELSTTVAAMVPYATHVVQPDGTWPLVSDTFPRGRPTATLWDDPGYRYAATAGQEGAAPTERAIAFPEAGYVIMRDGWTDDGRATYLHLTAAYHTDYHKHADDLSLWLYHDGPLLTELGPQGYDYDDPLVQCAYSDDAHNVATVDGLELPRTDGRHEDTRLTRVDLDGPTWRAAGVNERIDGVDFEREVAYDPEAGVVEVTDRVRTDVDRAVRVRWHLDPSVTARVSGDEVELIRDDRDPVRGVFEAPGELDLRVLGPDTEGCTGLRFGEDEPVETSTLELHTEPRTVTEVVSRFELP